MEPHRPPNSSRVTTSLSGHSQTNCIATFFCLLVVIVVNFIFIGYRELAIWKLVLWTAIYLAVLYVLDIVGPVIWTFLHATLSPCPTMHTLSFDETFFQSIAHHLRQLVFRFELDAYRKFGCICCAFSHRQKAQFPTLALLSGLCLVTFPRDFAGKPEAGEAVQVGTKYCNNNNSNSKKIKLVTNSKLQVRTKYSQSIWKYFGNLQGPVSLMAAEECLTYLPVHRR